MKKFLRALVFVFILFLTLSGAEEVLRLKKGGNLPKSYYTERTLATDVILLGPSTSQWGYYPMELWGSLGLTSYNLATADQSMMCSYYILRDVLKRDHPELVILDCNQMRLEESIVKESYLHYITDVLPFYSTDRIRLIHDYSVRENVKPGKEAAIMVPFLKWHSNWKNLDKSSFTAAMNTLSHGARVKTYFWQKTVEPYNEAAVDPEYQLPETSEEYLRKIIALCKNEGIDLFLVTLPVPGKRKYMTQEQHDDRYNAALKVAEIAEEEGLFAENLLDSSEELGIDLQTDTADAHHFNALGAEKVTAWISSYLEEHYSLKDHRSDPAYVSYEESYEVWRDYIDKKLAAMSNAG